VGPSSAYSDSPSVQDDGSPPRQRQCLLKGCECWFRSACPFARYCSAACVRAARRWSCWLANRLYRQSEQGRQQRRDQSRRRRERERARNNPAMPPPDEREGYHKAIEAEKNPCHRPGCYECFAPSARSPLQKFCSRLCRQALRHVLEREARWRRRFERWTSVLGRSLPRRC
jgi:hypothetical protein